MSTAFPKPPRQSIKALRKGLDRNHRKSAFEVRGTQKLRDNEAFVLPHVVYFARLNHVKEGTGLQYARPVAWRYFVGSPPSKLLALAEINIERSGAHTFASIHTAPQDYSHYKLLAEIAEESQTKGRFVFRLVRIPCVHVIAIWLRSLRRNDDVIVPLVPRGHFLVHRRFYIRPEFEALIRTEARAHFKSSLKTV
jgi:hypothetical protein